MSFRVTYLIRVLAFVLLCCGSAWADFTPDPRYKEADQLLRESRFVKAREIGEAMLKADPNSFEAQSILGRVHLYGEGNPGKADYYLRKSHKTIVSTFDAPSTAQGPWDCYGDVLWSLRVAAMDLEEYEQAIGWVDEAGLCDCCEDTEHLVGRCCSRRARVAVNKVRVSPPLSCGKSS